MSLKSAAVISFVSWEGRGLNVFLPGRDLLVVTVASSGGRGDLRMIPSILDEFGEVDIVVGIVVER